MLNSPQRSGSQNGRRMTTKLCYCMLTIAHMFDSPGQCPFLTKIRVGVSYPPLCISKLASDVLGEYRYCQQPEPLCSSPKTGSILPSSPIAIQNEAVNTNSLPPHVLQCIPNKTTSAYRGYIFMLSINNVLAANVICVGSMSRINDISSWTPRLSNQPRSNVTSLVEQFNHLSFRITLQLVQWVPKQVLEWQCQLLRLELLLHHDHLVDQLCHLCLRDLHG